MGEKLGKSWCAPWVAALTQRQYVAVASNGSRWASRAFQAQTQNRATGITNVEIRFPVLTDAQWDQVIEALSRQALYAAQLLDGTMPAEIEGVFATAGATLLPGASEEIVQSCSTCPPGTMPGTQLCRPLLAVYQQLGEMLREDPWLLLRLRGRDRQQVLAVLHERRNRTAPAPTTPTSATTSPAHEVQPGAFYRPGAAPAGQDQEPAPPLAAQLADFWGRRKVLEDIHYHLARPVVEHALLRRLGPPSPGPDGPDAFVQLQAVYQRVTDRVWALAFAPDEEELTPEGNGQE